MTTAKASPLSTTMLAYTPSSPFKHPALPCLVPHTRFLRLSLQTVFGFPVQKKKSPSLKPPLKTLVQINGLNFLALLLLPVRYCAPKIHFPWLTVQIFLAIQQIPKAQAPGLGA